MLKCHFINLSVATLIVKLVSTAGHTWRSKRDDKTEANGVDLRFGTHRARGREPHIKSKLH